MTQRSKRESLTAQLTLVLHMAGVHPAGWIVGTVVASLALAALDTLGVAAMVPLMTLVTGGDTQSGALGYISRMMGTDDVQVLIPVVAGIVAAAFVLKTIGALWFRWWLLGRTTLISARSATELMRRYALSPYSDHRSRSLSVLYRNINDATAQSASVLLAIVTMFSDIMVLIAIGFVLAATSLSVTIFAVALFGVLIGGVQRVLRRRQRHIGEEIADASLSAWQHLMPSLEGFREARLTSTAGRFVEGFEEARMRGARANRQMGIVGDAPRYVLEIGFIVAILGTFVILTAGGNSSAETITVLGVFAAASVRMLPTLTRVSAGIATTRIGQAGLRIVSGAVDELNTHAPHDETPHDGRPYSGDIVLRDIAFHYLDSDERVLDGISLTVRENTTIAFVGSSGAGKSTLLDVILGLLEPTEGFVECGGRPIGDDLVTWYGGLGVVPQDVFLLNATVRANIAFGVSPDAVDDARVLEVLAMAQLDGVIAGLPDGLDAIVGERGVRLSGGQRQRLGLARALYRQPRILVLDEATSALDNLTEHEISQTLAGLNGSLTILIVAHRLSTVRHADTVVFLEHGRVDAEGTFEHVESASPGFAQLVELGRL
jgi:ABC-type multidrug transport system fused ATPase/permease subunit